MILLIPISDANPRRSFPVVNLSLIAVNVLVFLYELTLDNRTIVTRGGRLVQYSDLDYFFQTFGVVPKDLWYWFTHPGLTEIQVPLSLITAQFLHGGWSHLLFNMLFLFIFGDNIEDIMGSVRYLVFYLLCGVIAGLTQTLISGPDSTIPQIGASGAIAGVLGAYLLAFPYASVTVVIPFLFLFLFPFRVPAVLVLAMWFVTQFFNGLLALTPQTVATGGVAFWAHVGGFVAGLVLVNLFRRRPRAPAVLGPP